ncbi:hypothetical protein [Alteripontixanthobacter muriae]|uniref:hypothetical protein n=1 Tax=Alteripontixanthobacter muriae TaxID=2705546 RepID=UPI001E3FCAAF|nr:hypothetical protein [Alteripontixanthobacter muriae]
MADDLQLQQSLRHFALHGMNAADVAMQNGLEALKVGHMADYRHWLGICSKLDRRAAAQLQALAVMHKQR